MKIGYKKILLSLFIALILVLPLRTQAQSKSKWPTLLPNCDKTVYIVSGTGDFTVDVPGQGKKQAVWPENYSSANGTIVQAYINRACGFNDFVQLFVNGYNFGLAVLGLVVLFFFIYGGFTLLISGGRANKVQEGKDIIKGAFYGTLVVFTGWLLVNFYIAALSGNTKGLIFGKFWWGGQNCHETYKEKCEKDNLYEGCGGEVSSPTDTYVKQLQSALNKMGCDCGTVDGCFGNQTTQCVANFQFTNDLIREIGETNVGKVNETTWNALDSLNQAGTGTACLDNYEADKALIEGVEQPEEEKYCCEPFTPDCPNCACYQTSDKTCGGLTKKMGEVGKTTNQYLYSSSVNLCLTRASCNWGCCVPDLPGDCLETTSPRCDDVINDFKKGSNCDINECKWHICVRGINDCFYQKNSCPGGTSESGTRNSKEGAQNAILGIENCNYGTCALAAMESCVWTSEKKCGTVAGADFYYNIQVDSNNNIPNAGVHCDPAKNLIIP